MGLEIELLWVTMLMFGSLAVFLMAGLPLAFVTGGVGCIFLFVFGSASQLNILPSRIFPYMTDYQLSAIPLFIFMAAMLERAGLIQELFDVVYKLLGVLRGGRLRTISSTSSGTSLRKREGAWRLREPRTRRSPAVVSTSVSMARVIAT